MKKITLKPLMAIAAIGIFAAAAGAQTAAPKATPVPKASPPAPLPDIYTKKDAASPTSIEIFNTYLAEEYENEAKAAIKKSNYKGALENYTKAIELQPKRAEYYVARGTLYDDNMPNMKGDALIDFTKAIELDPKSKQALLGIGDILSDHSYGLYEKAIPYFTAYIALDQKNFVAYASRGMCLGKLGKKAEAIADLKKALQLEPGQEYAEYNLNALQMGGKVLDGYEWSSEYGNNQVI